ncbi:MAG: TlpA disulfide reductase family protein [Nocardioidaceae bacterium]
MLPLVGCSSLSGTEGKGYISADGQITVYAAADRSDPVKVEGTSLDDEPVSITGMRGTPVVVNLWWSACGPCRAEAGDLARAHDELSGKADFVGINIRDSSPSAGRLFEQKKGIPYPSIYDPDGAAVLAFAGYVRQGAIPSTVVLDEEGRIAAVVSGPIPSAQTLVDLVDEVTADG